MLSCRSPTEFSQLEDKLKLSNCIHLRETEDLKAKQNKKTVHVNQMPLNRIIMYHVCAFQIIDKEILKNKSFENSDKHDLWCF